MNKIAVRSFFRVSLFLASFILVLIGTVSANEIKKAAIIIAFSDFNDTEYSLTRSALEKNNVLVRVVSSRSGKAKSGDLAVPVDLLIEQLIVSEYAAVIFIGGLGVADEYYDNPGVDEITREAVKQGKILAGICAAQRIIYKSDAIEYKLPDHTIPPGQNVRVEGKVILGGGPGDAKLFAKAIVNALNGVHTKK